MVTAYDYPSAVHVDQVGAPAVAFHRRAHDCNRLCARLGSTAYSSATLLRWCVTVMAWLHARAASKSQWLQVIHGHDTTLAITVDEMLMHCRAVRCAAPLLVSFRSHRPRVTSGPRARAVEALSQSVASGRFGRRPPCSGASARSRQVAHADCCIVCALYVAQ
jgi:hypothetical protein